MAWPMMKQGWTGNDGASSSISAPPAQLMAIGGIVVFLLWFPSYTGTQPSTDTSRLYLKMLLLLLLIWMAYSASTYGRLSGVGDGGSGGGPGESPWGVALLLLLLLLLISHHPNFKSIGSPLL